MTDLYYDKHNAEKPGGSLVAGKQVYALIHQQNETWRRLEHNDSSFSERGPHLFIGSGTSYYIAKVASAYARALGWDAQSAPTAEVLVDPELWLPHFGSVVIISRSGTTSEANMVAQRAQTYPNCRLAVLTCNGASPLATQAHDVYVAEGSDDQTVVMIRSFTSMLVLLQQLIAASASVRDDAWLGDYFGEVVTQADPLVGSIIPPVPRRIYVLGGGIRQGIADEGVLKMQEMAGAPAFSFNPMEFRHGPWGSVTSRDIVVLLGQRARRLYEQDLVVDLRERGVRVVPIAPSSWFEGLSDVGLKAVVLPDAIPDVEAGPLAVIPLQLLAWYWAVQNGEDPDAPRNLQAVVVLKHE